MSERLGNAMGQHFHALWCVGIYVCPLLFFKTLTFGKVPSRNPLWWLNSPLEKKKKKEGKEISLVKSRLLKSKAGAEREMKIFRSKQRRW